MSIFDLLEHEEPALCPIGKHYTGAGLCDLCSSKLKSKIHKSETKK